jgi:NADH dehydrogenase [ubiquinone] 1 alpha subcomplex assembly factor 1
MPGDLFHFEEAASVEGWSAVDDRVMGGVSRSRLRHDPAGHAVFEGELSLEQGGGFASVRSGPLEPGLPATAAYLLEVRGDGKRYRLSVRTEEAVDGVSHQASFETTPGAWILVRLPVAGFAARFRGRTVTGATPLDPARASQLGLMIADRQAGRFALAIRSIRPE